MNEEIKNKFNIALLQISPTGDIKRNIEKGIKYCKKAKEKGADIAVFPEMWSNGYEHIFSGYLKDQKQLDVKKVEEWKSKEIDENSVFIQSFKKTAKELEMAIAITYLERHSPLPKNTVAIIDRNGNIILIDENASCHLALGRGFPKCVKNGKYLTDEELKNIGLNISNIHVDFMIGTHDLEIIGETFDNKTVKIFENGCFKI